MIESIEFKNFKALRQTTLPLAPFTLLLGPNGSGKSTVLQALRMIGELAGANPDAKGMLPNANAWPSLVSVGAKEKSEDVQLTVHMKGTGEPTIVFTWFADGRVRRHGEPTNTEGKALLKWLNRLRVYALDASAVSKPASVNQKPLQGDGANLAAVLDDLKDNHPDQWTAMLAEMRRWLPEYDYILFDKPGEGQKGLVLRTLSGGHRIPAVELSQGTLIALTLLTLAYSPAGPSLVGLEEIDRGLHPRLLRHLQDALYGLTYPSEFGENRPAVQVIATTHSPYLLDLYRDHPEQIVLAQKSGLEVTMAPLSAVEHFQEILGDAPLSDVWYSGVLGGVSVKP